MKKEIVIIMSALHGGGAEKVLIDYLNNFDYKKYNVTLCLVIHEGIYLENIPIEVKVVFLYPKFNLFPYRVEHWLSKYLKLHWFQKRRVAAILGNKKFDTAISYMEGIPLKFHNYFFKYAKRHISWIHSDLYHFHYSLSLFTSKKQEEHIYKKMDALVFVSDFAKKQFFKLYNLNVPQKVIYNIIDKKNIQKSITNDYIVHPEIKLVAVGRLERIKRFDRLITAAELCKNDGLSFTIDIIGEGSLYSELEKTIKEKNLSEIVFLRGFIKPPYNAMNACDVLVSTSEVEGFSLVIAEAMCLGKAIITTPTAGPLELVENGKYGIVCDHDENAIYEAIKSIIINKDKLVKYQDLALERSAFFEVKQSINKFEQLIDNE